MSANIEFEKLDKKLDGLFSKIDKLEDTIKKMPNWIGLPTLAYDIGISRQTLHKHIISNYEPEVDFNKQNNSIMISCQIVPLIKDYYERKSKK